MKRYSSVRELISAIDPLYYYADSSILDCPYVSYEFVSVTKEEVNNTPCDDILIVKTFGGYHEVFLFYKDGVAVQKFAVGNTTTLGGTMMNVKTMMKIAGGLYGALCVYKGIELAVKMTKVSPLLLPAPEYGTDVYEDNGMMAVQRLKVACVTMLTNGTAAIMVDDTFKSMSVEDQQAILSHERGHVALGHLDNVSSINGVKRLFASVTGVQDIELEADAYAADEVGKEQVISMLEGMKSIKGINKREINNRIKALKN